MPARSQSRENQGTFDISGYQGLSIPGNPLFTPFFGTPRGRFCERSLFSKARPLSHNRRPEMLSNGQNMRNW